MHRVKYSIVARVYLAQKFRSGEGNMGEVEVIGCLGDPRGWVWEGDVPLPREAQEAKV